MLDDEPNYADLARQHLQTARVALSCAQESRVPAGWARIAAHAAATSAVDAILQRDSAEWREKKGESRSAAERTKHFKKLGMKPWVYAAWGRLKLAYGDRYGSAHVCELAEANKAVTDATSILKEILG